MSALAVPPYPLTFSVDYPDRELNRVTTGFRLILGIPLLLLLALFARSYPASAGLLLFLPVLALLVLRHKYPRWWFDFNLQLVRLEARIYSYLFLLRDEYPSVDEEQAVRVEIVYPDAENDLNRWLPLVKWLLAIPHYVVLVFLYIAAVVVVIIAWFAILFTGRYPSGMFDFVVGVLRWSLRVAAYAFLLVTDRYPPFSLAP
ncbi:MAG TPA: DUF4389 domain-containing protein [Acidimicrobiia bacterium]|nr:DUF4389 domain-containing protein [Acidimicrobiia bacterium]HMF83510.1 DUF4389 domain-containing protein [Acidimicrobiia bacterium]